MADNHLREQITALGHRIGALHKQATCQPSPSQDPSQNVLCRVLQDLELSFHELETSQDELLETTQLLGDAYKTLQTERRRFQELFDFAPDGYVVTDANGTIREANRAAAKLLGVGRGDLAGKPLIVYIAAEERKAFHAFLAYLRSGSTQTIEPVMDWQTRMQPRGRESCPVSITCGLRHEAGQVMAVRWLLHDITERKRAESEVASSQMQLRLLFSHLQAAREEERAEVAREIHDEFGQTLAGLKLEFAWLARHVPPGASAVIPQKMRTMLGQLDATIEMVRRMSTALRPAGLDDLGLEATVEWHARQLEQRTGIRAHLNLTPPRTSLDPACTTAVFRIYQEALANVVRHAEASRISILLKEEDDVLTLEVTDNGRGISKKELADPVALGIIGMRERAIRWGGIVDVSRRKKGTRVLLRIPLEKARLAPKPDVAHEGACR